MAAVPSSGPAATPFPGRETPEAEVTRELYERYGAQLLTFCLNRLRNREEAEDAAQSTFLNALRGLQNGICPELESAWLYRIARNVCVTRQRSSWRRRRVEAPRDLDAIQDLLPGREPEADELIRLPDALGGIPEQQRRALILRDWQGLTYREIASELDLSLGAVETLLFRARRSLARGLTDDRRFVAGTPAARLDRLQAVPLGSRPARGKAKPTAERVVRAATGVVATTPPRREARPQANLPRGWRPASLLVEDDPRSASTG
jgi:RNA polymerase sigma factor (sigma-70 family)